MKAWIEEYLGKVFLLLALAWSALAAFFTQTPPQDYPEAREVSDPAQVQVKLTLEKAASSESFFPERAAAEFREPARTVFVPERKVVEYKPVELAIPPARVQRPAQLLPSPGPALEGTQSLPRWGDEFPPLVLPPPPEKDKKP